MSWQVGELEDFKDDDPVFDDKQDAINYATELSEEKYEGFYGLWTSQDDGGELVAIFHSGWGYWS